MTLTIPSFSLANIGPWLTLTGGAVFILLADALFKLRKTHYPYLSLAFLALAAYQTVGLWGARGTDFARMVYVDNFAFLFYFILILGAALTVLLSRPYLEDWGRDLSEYYALVLFATAGMMMMAASAHMIMLFLGLEVMSVAVYVLAGFFREDVRSNEAALKYLVLGAFASAFLLFGMAFLYGAAGGTLYFDELARSASRWPRCRSTCGFRMFMKARPPLSPRSWRWRSRPQPSPRLPGSSFWFSRPSIPTGTCCCGSWPWPP